MQIDLRVTELLSSKICHDLISPVSAINNGVELIDDIGDSVMVEAMKLIADSAGQASRRLRLFRIAYGRAGSEANLPVRDVRLVAEQYFSVGKIKIIWPDTVTLDLLAESRGGLKTLLNGLLMAEEVLAYGGEIAVTPREDGQGNGCIVRVTGRGASLAPVYREALDGATPVEDLTPRSVQSYMTGLFARQFGFAFSFENLHEDTLLMVMKSGAAEYDNLQEKEQIQAEKYESF